MTNTPNHSFPIQWIEETDSTNSSILDFVKNSGPKKLVLIADHQTAGRGQFGRTWFALPGENLLFSIYFEPDIKPVAAPLLTLASCHAVLEVLTSYGIICSVKLPNDILVNGKKICGILTESSSRGEKLDHVVVGIGLNVNSTTASLIPGATSMGLETEKVYDRAEILDKILVAFEKKMAAFPETAKAE